MFDYRRLECYCQYGVPNRYNDVDDCSEPATHEVWWSEDRKDKMYVCQEHFDFIEEKELEDNSSG